VVGEGHDDAVAAAHVGFEVALGFGEPARGDRGALSLEGIALASRERRELGRAPQVGLDPELLENGPARVVRLPDEICRGKRRHQVRGERRSSLLPEPRLDQIGAALGGRVDDGLRERVQRALREGRERPQRLDLVSEELDADRLPSRRGEDVDDASAHGELTALLRLLDALVARQRQALGQAVHPRTVTGANRNGLGASVCRRDALREADGRGAHEAPGREDVERAGTFPDEMGRRLEPAPPADAAGGEEPYPSLAQEPARGLGGVARVGILREDADERAVPAREVERREEEREKRLRNARVGRTLRELPEAVSAGELASESGEDGFLGAGELVHDEGRKSPSAGRPS
jgi:hypothetical protein